jgi:hypothetical protein
LAGDATTLRSRPDAVVDVSARLLLAVLAVDAALMVLLLSTKLDAPETRPTAVIETSPVAATVDTELLALCAELTPATMPFMLPMFRFSALLLLLTLPVALCWLLLAESAEPVPTVVVVILLLANNDALSWVPLSAWALTKAKSALAFAPLAPLASLAWLMGLTVANKPPLATGKPDALTVMLLLAVLPLAAAVSSLLFKLSCEPLTPAAVMATDNGVPETPALAAIADGINVVSDSTVTSCPVKY